MITHSDRNQVPRWQRLIADNSLTLALSCLFLLCLSAQSVAAWHAYNESLLAAKEASMGYGQFLLTGTFQNAIFNNWQAAILQLVVLVGLSSVLRQRGAAHSRLSPEEKSRSGVDCQTSEEQSFTSRHPIESTREPAALALHASSFRQSWLYKNSLLLVLLAMFLVFYCLHVWTNSRAYNEEQAIRHLRPEQLISYLASPNLWSATLENWQAEFFAISTYIVLTIFLRQERSPESKRVDVNNSVTGETNE